jgi:hypothetical protein
VARTTPWLASLDPSSGLRTNKPRSSCAVTVSSVWRTCARTSGQATQATCDLLLHSEPTAQQPRHALHCMHGLTRRPETQSAYSYYAGAEGAWPYAWARTCDLSLVVSVVFLSSSETAMGLTPPKSAVPFQILRDSQAKQREGVLLLRRVSRCAQKRLDGWIISISTRQRTDISLRCFIL